MRVLALAGSLAAACVLTACGGAARAPVAAHPRSALAAPPSLSAEDFPRAAVRVLREEPSPERQGLLVAVVRRQLTRAVQRFALGGERAGLDALVGALFFVRAGELDERMLVGAAPALRAGAEAASRVGREGSAIALYSLLRRALPEGRTRRDVDEHLAVIRGWQKAPRGLGVLEASGAAERASLARALLEPTPETLGEARDLTQAWVRLAIERGSEMSPRREGFDRDEAVEAYRAVRLGAWTLVGLELRHGDARAAADSLESDPVARTVPPALHEQLRAAADEHDPRAWEELVRVFESARAADEPELGLDREFARAAAWGASVGLFRASPGSLRAAVPLAGLLLDLGMPDVGTALIAEAMAADPSSEAIAFSSAFALRAIASSDVAGDLEAARRCFAEAAPIFDLARSPTHRGRIAPSPARASLLLGAIETRAGDLERALPHVQKAVEEEPTVESLRLLARIRTQKGEPERALGDLGRVAALAERAGDGLAIAEGALASFYVHRDTGKTLDATNALSKALVRVLETREVTRAPNEKAEAERVLAEILALYRDLRGARRATERAWEASRNDARQLSATALDSARRALVTGDLSAGRDAVRRSLDAKLAGEDLVYAAIWLRILERRLGVPSDGTVEEAIAAVDDPGAWPARLRAWMSGSFADAALLAAARTASQKTEARFYVAMAKSTPAGGEAIAELRAIASSTSIDLIEVSIARELIAAAEHPLALDVPPGVRLP